MTEINNEGNINFLQTIKGFQKVSRLQLYLHILKTNNE